MSGVVGIVPAAGLSSRMGAFKPLLPVDAESGEERAEKDECDGGGGRRVLRI